MSCAPSMRAVASGATSTASTTRSGIRRPTRRFRRASRFADQSGKAACKAKLQSDFGLPERPDVPVIGVVARLADQKGWGDVISNIEHMLEQGKDVQYVLMGQGDKHLAEQLQGLKERFPDRVAFDPTSRPRRSI